jgi:ParB family transcriptional regulator, chromosome partitioning protein
MVKIKEIKELPMDKMVIGKGQVRVTHPERNLDELVASIRKHGLLSPIIVVQTPDGKYEILTGQRRFLASAKLQKSTILAAVLDERVSEEEAKILSLTENLVRDAPVDADYIDACTSLYKKYGSVQTVADKIGISPTLVSEYLKYDMLPPGLQKMVDARELPMKTALRATKAAMTDKGAVDEVQAVKFAKELTPMTGTQQDKVVKAATKLKGQPFEKKIEAGRAQAQVTQILVTLGDEVHASLQQYADDEGTTQDDAAAGLIETALSTKGYVPNK